MSHPRFWVVEWSSENAKGALAQATFIKKAIQVTTKGALAPATSSREVAAANAAGGQRGLCIINVAGAKAPLII